MKTRLYVLSRGEQSWTRLADPPFPWDHCQPSCCLPGRLVTDFCVEEENNINRRYELWLYTLADDRWEPLDNNPPWPDFFHQLAAYDRGFVIYPHHAERTLDQPFYHGTFGAVDDDDKPRVTYTTISTPALGVARAWAQAAGFDIPLRDEVVPHLADRPEPRRELRICVASPVRF